MVSLCLKEWNTLWRTDAYNQLSYILNKHNYFEFLNNCKHGNDGGGEDWLKTLSYTQKLNFYKDLISIQK